MELFSVKYCIVCEDMRMERFNKTTILGFYGITPDVSIKLLELGKSIERLAFLLAVKVKAGTYKIKFNLLNPDNKVIVERDMDFTADDKGELAFLALTLLNLLIEKDGKYTIKLLQDNKELYKTTFDVAVGDPSLFK